MRSTPVKYRWPWILDDVMKKIMAEEGFPNIGRLMTALAIREAIRKKRWGFVKMVAMATPNDQDELLDFLLTSDQTKFRSMIVKHNGSNKPNEQRK